MATEGTELALSGRFGNFLANEPQRVTHSLRSNVLPSLREERRSSAGGIARALAQFRRRGLAGDRPGHGAPRVRSRDHAFRPREQLRASAASARYQRSPRHAGNHSPSSRSPGFSRGPPSPRSSSAPAGPGRSRKTSPRWQIPHFLQPNSPRLTPLVCSSSRIRAIVH